MLICLSFSVNQTDYSTAGKYLQVGFQATAATLIQHSNNSLINWLNAVETLSSKLLWPGAVGAAGQIG